MTTELDADRGELNEALRAFTRQSLGADVALVFYAGHGMEMDGANYLVPVDARLERDVDVRFETVTLEDMLASTLWASLRLVILDACRNNPLARSMQRTLAGRSVSGGSFGNLNEDLLGDETLVAYAAAAGTTAADGRGRNSPYTAALLAHLEQPVEIGLLFRRVRAQVLASTNGQQRPHEYQSLVGEHYLSVPPTAESVTVEAALPVAVVDIDVAELDVAQLRQLAEQGDARAQTELGERYEDGRDGVQQNYGMAVSWFRRAADQGNANGQAALGFMYENGRGVAQDDGEAVRWYRRAAEQGYANGQANLGVMYENGRAGWRRTTGKPSGGTDAPQNRDTPAGRTTSATCTTPVAGWRRTTGKPSGGTDAPQNRETPAGRTTSATCTGTVAGWRRTTPKPSDGTAAPLSRDTPTGRPTSAPCTRTVSGWRRTTGKPSGGSDAPQNRDTPAGRPISAACTATVAGWRGTTGKPSGGTDAPQNRETPTGRPTSASCTRTVAGCVVIAWKPPGGTA